MRAEPKRRGRPPGPALPPEQQTKPRSIRLTDAQWAMLQALTVSGWLAPLLDSKRQQDKSG